MFKITNEQLIQIAAVDAGLNPFAEYCTKGIYKAAGYSIRKDEIPVLTLELWCPRVSKDSAAGEILSSDSPQQDSKMPGLFFQFKKCNLFCRSQVVSADELQAEKEAAKVRKAQECAFKKTVRDMGGIAPPKDYESIPQWATRKAGMAIDVMVGELSQVGYQVQDANGLFDLLQTI